jgi:CheY-like chemotaxis protein
MRDRRGERKAVICVDDEENPLVLRKLVLQKAGYEVTTAASAMEALAITSSGHYFVSSYSLGNRGCDLPRARPAWKR